VVAEGWVVVGGERTVGDDDWGKREVVMMGIDG